MQLTELLVNPSILDRYFTMLEAHKCLGTEYAQKRMRNIFIIKVLFMKVFPFKVFRTKANIENKIKFDLERIG